MKPRCLLVLGMHRSGTSALTRVLNLLGAALSRGLIASKPSNVTGFWESQQVLDINNVLLKQFGLLWRDDLPIPSEWLQHPAAREAGDLISAYLREEFSGKTLFAIKDPRLCRVLPLWIRAVKDFGAEPVCIICYRHPVEVAASLQARDGLPLEPSLHLWMRSYLDAERDSRGYPRLMVAYDDLLGDWRAVVARIADTFDISWPTPTAIAGPEIEAFLSPSHRHHRESGFETVSDPHLCDATRGMFEQLAVLARDESAGWNGRDLAPQALLEARDRRHGPVIRLERTAYFEERDDKRRLKHYNQRLEEKLRDAKSRLLRLKRKWKLIVAIVAPLVFALGFLLGRFLAGP